MADYHIMTGDASGKMFRVIMHIAVPAETNFAGKTLAVCIVEDPEATKTTLIPWDIGAEATAIAAGTLLEREAVFVTNMGSTNLEKRGQLDALYQKHEAEEVARLRLRYWAWGFERNVP